MSLILTKIQMENATSPSVFGNSDDYYEFEKDGKKYIQDLKTKVIHEIVEEGEVLIF